ncbi:MAG: type II toxin-antitoxin system RelE/ParE family toxin [Pseudobdellovibrionaceae bacterium]|nr:type II toxin-antitoxin system RelE/ParE family toxin [Bdellovibrionales bacterium]USN47196.1 MAG: type II toxin-antitoxin system RelE/ParE family toxin [Pseudobdellovibrionaceae bacterium]
MEIVWSPQALKDIESIGDFIAEDNPPRAITFVDELIDSVERLTRFPESGSIVEENPIFRQIVYDGYRLIYQLRTKRILIIAVLGPGRFLKKT